MTALCLSPQGPLCSGLSCVPATVLCRVRRKCCVFISSFLQGVKPASYNKVMDPEIKEIIGECTCQKKEER